ncbi:restriction endonuclease subunit S [Chloroflexota bacterium]
MKHKNRTALPPGWQLRQLGDVIDIRNGYAFRSRDFASQGVLLIRQSNLSSSGITTDEPIYLPKHYLKKYADHRVIKGDVLIGMSGSIGKLCICDLETPSLQNQRTGLIRFHVPEYAAYITYYLRFIKNKLLALSKGEAVKNISSSQIKSFYIPLAPIDEAEHIASRIKTLLFDLERVIEKLTAAKTSLNNYRNAVLQKAFYNKQNGNRVKLGKVAAIRNGYSFSVKQAIHDDKAVPFFKVADLAQTDGQTNPYLSKAKYYISADECYGQRLKPLQPGTTVFAKTGEAIKLNRRAILKLPALIDNNMMGVLSSSDKLDNTYLYYFLLSVRLQELGRATTIPSLRKSDVSGISIPLPSISEQLRITAETERCLVKANNLEKAISDNIEQAEMLRQSIFKRAFEGKLASN